MYIAVARVVMYMYIHSAYCCIQYIHVCVCLDILRKFDDMIEVILPQLPTTFDSIQDPEGKAALIWILGEYGEVHVRVHVHVHTCVCHACVCVHVCAHVLTTCESYIVHCTQLYHHFLAMHTCRSCRGVESHPGYQPTVLGKLSYVFHQSLYHVHVHA